ncbi:hypothetical protein FUAX_27560 [Fulvitalea axinellae]|uniref:Uncharacterized protein n=1 Tax=Fulvitalea axinellae TaxID=1182444 RepID=A0AAU9D723_9BACT|nr:hypothetical protein FUAX_27560 [Fulvitalea axinellae]
MKKLIIPAVIPATLLSFLFVTKWWFAYPEDAPESFLYGFPLPYKCDGWHTSMSYQIFILELLFDLSVYFLFWLSIFWLIHRRFPEFRINKTLRRIFLSFNVFIVTFNLLVSSASEHVFSLNRDFRIDTKETSIFFFWQLPQDKVTLMKRYPYKKFRGH